MTMSVGMRVISSRTSESRFGRQFDLPVSIAFIELSESLKIATVLLGLHSVGSVLIHCSASCIAVSSAAKIVILSANRTACSILKAGT